MIMSSRGNDMSEAAPAKMIRLKTSEPLVVDVVKGRSRTLVVSLAGVGQERDLAPPAEFFGSATQFGENHAIFVSDIKRALAIVRMFAGRSTPIFCSTTFAPRPNSPTYIG